jgi:hypothetical protein
MRTYPHQLDDGSISYFEISNGIPWSLGFMRRVLTSVTEVSDFARGGPPDCRFTFTFRGRKCIVCEPWGDNSRYWIGALDEGPPLDLRAVHDAFRRFRFRFTWDWDFWS